MNWQEYQQWEADFRRSMWVSAAVAIAACVLIVVVVAVTTSMSGWHCGEYRPAGKIPECVRYVRN